jgi:hypothetical protein
LLKIITYDLLGKLLWSCDSLWGFEGGFVCSSFADEIIHFRLLVPDHAWGLAFSEWFIDVWMEWVVELGIGESFGRECSFLYGFFCVYFLSAARFHLLYRLRKY